MKTLEFTGANQYQEIILIDKIARLSRTANGDTIIHLINGDQIWAEESIKTLNARINSNE